MENSRRSEIEGLAGSGELEKLKIILGAAPTQTELDAAFENAIAYSQTKTAEYLLFAGANINSDFASQGAYFAIQNDELEGLKFIIENGVNINLYEGIFLNKSIISSAYSKNIEITKWLLKNGANPKYLTKQSLEIADKQENKELKSLLNNSLFK